jgi:hypothetical protein
LRLFVLTSSQILFRETIFATFRLRIFVFFAKQ